MRKKEKKKVKGKGDHFLNFCATETFIDRLWRLKRCSSLSEIHLLTE